MSHLFDAPIENRPYHYSLHFAESCAQVHAIVIDTLFMIDRTKKVLKCAETKCQRGQLNRY